MPATLKECTESQPPLKKTCTGLAKDDGNLVPPSDLIPKLPLASCKLEVPHFESTPETLSAATDIETSRAKGYNETRFEKIIGSIQVKKHVAVPKPPQDIDEDPFAFVYTHPKLVVRRNYTPEVRMVNSGRNGDLWELRAVEGITRRYFTRVSFRDFTRGECNTLCTLLVDALNRWPDIDDISMPRPPANSQLLVLTLLTLAMCRALPEKAFTYNAPRVGTSVGHPSLVYYSITLLDPDTLKVTSPPVRMHIHPASLKTHLPVPKAENIIWAHMTHGFGKRFDQVANSTCLTETKDSGVRPGERDGLIYAERFARYLSVWFLRHCSPVRTRQQAVQVLDDKTLILQGTRRGQAHLKTYDGGSFFTTATTPWGNTRIVAPEKFQENLTHRMPLIMVGSSDLSWTMEVTDAGIRKWVATGNPVEGWMEMARKSDNTNARIAEAESSPVTCVCPPDSEAVHDCGRCGRETPCKSLKDHPNGYRACEACHRSMVGWRPTFERLKEIIRTRTRSDAEKGGRDTAWRERLRASLVNQVETLLGQGEGNYYVDTYSSSEKVLSHPDKFHPSKCSLDAVFPFALTTSTGNGFYTGNAIHCVGNVVVTRLDTNYVKHIQVPATLPLTRDYYRAFIGLEGGVKRGDPIACKELEALEATAVNDFNRLAHIRRKVPFKVSSRLNFRVSRRQYEYLKEEWVSGKLHPGTPHSTNFVADTPYSTTSLENQWPRVKHIAEEFQAWTGVTLPSRAGCPYFLHSSTMPALWDWKMCHGLVGERLAVMTIWCNGKWVTVDDEVTIYLECIFQVCIRKMVVKDEDPEASLKRQLQSEYAEFLGLPLSRGKCNHLSFVVAHKHHGHQMRTGWPRRPKSFRDRINADNNILIETRASNFLKFKFAESYYPLLKQMVLDIDVPSSWANLDLQLSPYDARLEPGSVVWNEEDDFAAEVNADAERDWDLGEEM